MIFIGGFAIAPDPFAHSPLDQEQIPKGFGVPHDAVSVAAQNAHI